MDPKGCALCREPFLAAQDKSERLDFAIQRMSLQEMLRNFDFGTRFGGHVRSWMYRSSTWVLGTVGIVAAATSAVLCTLGH